MKSTKKPVKDPVAPQNGANPTTINVDPSGETASPAIDEKYGENDSIKKEKQSPGDLIKRQKNGGLDVNTEG